MADSIEDAEKLEPLYIQTLLLSKVVKRTLQQRGNISLSDHPTIKKAGIVEFMKRMRIWSLGKFEGRTYISYISFYKTEQDKNNDKAVGSIALYIEEDYICYLFKKLGYPNLEEDDEEELMDACGTLCNIFAGLFRQGLVQLGYNDLEMSHFSNHINEVTGGVSYDTKETYKYIIGFDINKQRRLFVELTMGNIPKVER